MKRLILIVLLCLLELSGSGEVLIPSAAAIPGFDSREVANPGLVPVAERSLSIVFFLPGGELAERSLNLIIRIEGAPGLGADRRVDIKSGRHEITLPTDREPVIRLKVEGDNRRFRETIVTFTARRDLTSYPVFLFPAGDNALARLRPGLVNHDETVPSAARAAAERALTASEQGRLATAINEFTSALTLAPRFTSVLNQLGLLFYRSGNLVEAAAAFTQAATLCDRAPNSYLNLGVTLNRLGRYLESVTLLTGLLEANPSLVRIRIPLAEALVQIQQWDAAVEMVEPAIAGAGNLPPDLRAEAHYILARTMYREERFKAVIRELTLALEGGTVWANTANAWLLLGSAHLELKQHVEAEKALLKSLEIGGDSVIQARYRLGQLYFREKRFPEAGKELGLYVKNSRGEVDPQTIRDAQAMLQNIRSGK